MMNIIKITAYKHDVYVECPKCGNFEYHPINEQRHHLQVFEITDWSEDDEHSNEISEMKCVECKHGFRLEWDYNNKKP